MKAEIININKTDAAKNKFDATDRIEVDVELKAGTSDDEFVEVELKKAFGGLAKGQRIRIPKVKVKELREEKEAKEREKARNIKKPDSKEPGEGKPKL